MSLPTVKSPDLREGDMEAAVIEHANHGDVDEAYYLVRPPSRGCLSTLGRRGRLADASSRQPGAEHV